MSLFGKKNCEDTHVDGTDASSLTDARDTEVPKNDCPTEEAQVSPEPEILP